MTQRPEDDRDFVARLLEDCSRPDRIADRAFIRLAQAGIRPSEIASLRVSDVNAKPTNLDAGPLRLEIFVRSKHAPGGNRAKIDGEAADDILALTRAVRSGPLFNEPGAAIWARAGKGIPFMALRHASARVALPTGSDDAE